MAVDFLKFPYLSNVYYIKKCWRILLEMMLFSSLQNYDTDDMSVAVVNHAVGQWNKTGLVVIFYLFIYLFVCFIRSNIHQKQHINTMTCEQYANFFSV